MKKFIALLLLGSLMLLTLSSCRKIKDPFKTSLDDFSSGNNSVSVSEPSKHSSGLQEIPEDPFYSMSALESAKIYGVDDIYDNYFDGEMYYYEYEDKSYTNEFGIKVGYKVPYRYPYGHPEKKTVVCTDPLCSHRPDSGCPFVNFKSYCAYKGTLFYFTRTRMSGEETFELCMYDEKKGKKVVLDSGEYINSGTDGSVFLRKSGDSLYYFRMMEGENFETYRACYKLDEKGKLTKIADASRRFGFFPMYIYDDRLLIIISTRKEDGDIYDNYEETVYKLGVYDVQTGKEQLIHSWAFQGYIIGAGYSFSGHRIYGNKLLYGLYYPEEEYTEEINGEEVKKTRRLHGWYLLNLDTMEEETVLEYYNYDTGWLSYNDHCFSYSKNRTSEEEPLIFHVVFPQEDREEVYDLSALVGQTIPPTYSVGAIINGAVQLFEGESHRYEVDLPSGRVRPLNPDGTPA